MPIIMNVGSSSASSSGSSGGGQTLGNAQGSITINVKNVEQANKILQSSAKAMEKAFNDTGKAAERDARVRIASSRAATAEAVDNTKKEVAANRAKVSAISVANAEQTKAAREIANQQRQTTRSQIDNSRIASAAATSASKIQVAANRVQTSNLAAATSAHSSAVKQQIANNRAQASSARLAATQSSIAANQQVQSIKVSSAQQSAAIKGLTAQQKQQHQSIIQGIQQQIAQNRLVVSNLNAQNAAARAAGQAQRAAAQQAVTGWQQFNKQINSVRTELFALSASATLFTGFGLQAAGNIQAARIQLGAMTGDLSKGSRLMDDLQKKGRAAGVPFEDMLAFATQLLPVLEGNTSELQEWFDIVRRTAVLNQSPTVGGVRGATFSLREAFLSVQQGGRDFVSLADRFNISKKALQEALEVSGGDFIQAMDLVLTKMGITTELADDMGKSFNASFALAKDAASRLVATGFEPLINVLAPALQLSVDYLGVVRQQAPATLAFAAALVSLTAVGSALLLLINQLTVAWIRMGLAAQTALSRAAKIGLVAGAIGIGIDVGAGIANRQRRAQGLPERDLFYALFNAIAQTVKLFQTIHSALLSFQEAIEETVATLLRASASLNDQIAKILPPGSFRQGFLDAAQNERQAAHDIQANSFSRRENVQAEWDRVWQNLIDLGDRWGIEGVGTHESSAAARLEQETLDKRRDLIIEWGREVEKIEADANRQRIKAAIDYGRQVNEVNFQYQQGLLREAEDFARNRLRQEQQLSRDIENAREEAARQEEQWREDLSKSIADITDDFNRNQREQQEDHDDKIAEIKEDTDEKLLELEEDYQKNREKALRDHRDKLLEAAAELDAKAVFEEQKRFFREQQEREEEHKDRIGKERDNEKERIDDENENFEKRRKREQEEFDRRLKEEQEAFEERLQEAREADERRIDDMREAFQIQRDIEDEDRQIRLDRQAADHQHQLDQMQLQHDDRMTEINRQEAEELQSLKDKHAEDLIETGLFNAARDQAEESFYRRSKLRHDAFYKDWEEKEAFLARQRPPQFGPQLSEYQSGGFVRQTGPAIVHAGEYVINPQMSRVLQDMLSSNFSHASMMSTTSRTGSRSNSVVFSGDVSISIMGSTNMGEGQMYAVARKAFTDALVELAN